MDYNLDSSLKQRLLDELSRGVLFSSNLILVDLYDG
jgi:hypothetical protein